MHHSTTIGIDVHGKQNTVFAVNANTGDFAEAVLPPEPEHLIKWIGKQGFATPIMAVYESGPTGFGLARSLIAAGIPCTIAATSRLPRRHDKKKNDREDARFLATQHIGGQVRAVWLPSEGEEAACNLSRLRAEAAHDLRRSRQKVSSFMLKMGLRHPEGKKWSQKFRRWAQGLELANPTDTYVFQEKLLEAYRLEERVARITERLQELVDADPALRAHAGRLRCLHGIGPVTANAIACELGDLRRFPNGRSLAAYLGLVPSDASSGEKDLKGEITKMGNGHIRRLLIEAASCYSRPSRLRPSSDPEVDPLVKAHAHKGSRRLLKRRQALAKRKKQANKAKVAIAREMAEWVYHVSVM